MSNYDMIKRLLLYGKVKSDFETSNRYGNFYRVRVFEYDGKKYFTVMCDGEPLELKEV